jgi:hypothetical protein
MKFSKRTRYLAGASFIALALTLSAPEDAAAQSCSPAFGNGAVVTCTGDFLSGISGFGFSDLSIYFGANSSVTTNSEDGVTLFGGGAQTHDASNATITSTFSNGFGIVAFTTGGAGDLTITTGASVTGDNSGITALQSNTGMTDINVGGDVTGRSSSATTASTAPATKRIA